MISYSTDSSTIAKLDVLKYEFNHAFVFKWLEIIVSNKVYKRLESKLEKSERNSSRGAISALFILSRISQRFIGHIVGATIRTSVCEDWTGSRKVSERYFSSPPMRDQYELFTSAHTKSSQKNISEFRKLLKLYSEAMQQPGSTFAIANSSVFILNLLAVFYKFGILECLTNDSMRASIQVLRHVFGKAGHFYWWIVLKTVQHEEMRR